MTDHKKDAEQFLEDALDEYSREGGPIRENVRDWLAIAQVTATLYLAEQQRIANLIAYAGFRVSTESDGEIGIQSDTVIALLRQAGEGLGIDE